MEMQGNKRNAPLCAHETLDLYPAQEKTPAVDFR